MKKRQGIKFMPLLLVLILLVQVSEVSAANLNSISYESNEIVSTVAASNYTGMQRIDGKWFYVVDGEIATSYTGLVKYNSKWVYVQKGQLNTNYTGLVKYNSKWVYVNKGKLDASYTGMVKYKNSWVYVKKGKLDTTYTGLAKNKYGWWYMNRGKLDLTYHGFSMNRYGEWYVTGGKLNTAVSGIVADNDSKWYVINGMIDTSYTGKVTLGNMVYYIEAGKVISERDKSKEAELKVWCSYEDYTSGWIDKVCVDFAKAYPEWDITFNIEISSPADAAKNMATDPTVGADVYLFASDQLPTLLNADAIAKLDDETADYVKETNSEKMVATVTNDGEIYGIPYTGNTWFMYYDKSVYTEDDVKSLDKMLEKGRVAFPFTNGWYFASFYAAGGGVFCGPNGDDEAAGVVLGDKGVEVTKYLVNLVNNKNFVRDNYGEGMSGLKDKSVNAMFSGSWDYYNIKEILGDNIGIVQLPTINLNGTECTLKSFAGSKAIGVNPYCDNQEVAVAFAKYLAGEEAQQLHYEMGGIVPCNTSLIHSDAFIDNELVQAQNNTIANTAIVHPSNVTFNNNYWSNAESMAWEILDGDVTEDNADEKTKSFEDAINGR